MKKLFLSTLIVTLLSVSNTVFAQTREHVLSFLSDRTMPFNKGVKIIKVDNLDSAAKVCLKKNISYCRDYFKFRGNQISEENFIGGFSRAIIRNKKVPFVMYNVYRKDGILTLELLTGEDAL